MEVFTASTITSPISSSYIGDADLIIRGIGVNTEEGISVYRENYLLSAADTSINNYSAIVLAGNQHNNDVFELKRIQYPHQEVITTTIKYGDKFLSISKDRTKDLLTTTSSQDTVFELEIQSDTTIRCAHQDGDSRYYLCFNNSEFYFTTTPVSLDASFKYILDQEKLYLFWSRAIGLQLYSVCGVLSSLSAVTGDWNKNAFSINTYGQELRENLDTTWASYDVSDRNSFQVNPTRSANYLASNNLFYTNYTHVTGNQLQTNFITLKNHHTHKNFSYRANNLTRTDLHVPNVNTREYKSMHTGVHQELGAESITLSYEFYNSDYKFAPDKYTIFRTPPSLYPFEQLNINDTTFAKNGAIAGQTPYTSDRIFFQDVRPGKSDGQFLCTWLSGGGPDVPSVWVDRYYIPERTTFAAALTSKSLQTYTDPAEVYLNAPLPVSSYYEEPFIYTTLESESAHTPQNLKDVLYGETFFDKRSDLALLPDAEYIYYRMGSSYIKSIVQSMSGDLIQDGLSSKTTKNSPIAYDLETDNIEYELDGATYAMVESFREVNTSNEFTVSFWLESDDWKQPFGHEILGNYNDRGFGVMNDEVVTPIIMIQDGTKVMYLNTNFDVVDTVYLSQSALRTTTESSSSVDDEIINIITTVNSTNIKDVHRTDHLDFSQCITSSIVYQLTSSIVSPYVEEPRCGLLLTETDLFLAPDHIYTTTSVQVTGIALEPCALSTVDIQPID